jgi:hypothetical protein
MNPIVEQVTAAYEHERAHARPVCTADQIPFTYELITPEWLTAVLCTKVPGAKVTGFRLDTPDDGNSNRRRIFVEYDATGRSAGLPESVFCKASQGLANRISLGPVGAVAAEVNFYRHVRPLLDIEAPVAWHAAVDPQSYNSIIMLGDLGPGTTFCSHTTDMTRARVEGQLRVLAALHGRFLESQELRTLDMIRSWPDFFGKLDYPDFEKACDAGFGIAQAVIPPRLFARRAEIWPATRRSMHLADALPHTLAHGDDHLRNWYITGAGAMGLNDWQALTRTHWARDVIYAMTTTLTVEHRRAWERELLAYYLDHLQRAAGRSLPVAGALDAMRQQLLSVLAFWTITINPAPGMPDMQPRDSTLEFIRRIVTAMDDLDALGAIAP